MERRYRQTILAIQCKHILCRLSPLTVKINKTRSTLLCTAYPMLQWSKGSFPLNDCDYDHRKFRGSLLCMESYPVAIVILITIVMSQLNATAIDHLLN